MSTIIEYIINGDKKKEFRTFYYIQMSTVVESKLLYTILFVRVSLF